MHLFLTTERNAAVLPTNEWVHGITPRIGFFSPSIPAVVLGVLYLGEHGGRTMVLVWFLRVPPLAGNPVHCCILLTEVPAAATLPAVVWEDKSGQEACL